uniref:Uncharacterized protein n=1 Tax=Clytia hemisphaerica TaxID=252671 RepID=A0A7M5V568_9CNID|eukprot:TCONS_00036380-protein
MCILSKIKVFGENSNVSSKSLFKIASETKVDITRVKVFTAKRKSVVDLHSKIESRDEFHQIGKSKNPRAMAFALENSNIKKLNTGRSQINSKKYHRVLKASYKNAVFKSQPFTEARVVIKAKRRDANDLIQQRPLPCVEMGESTVYKSTDDFTELADQFTNKITISSDVRSGETKVNKLFTPTDYVAKTLNEAESNVSKGRKRKSTSNVECDDSDDKDFEQLFKRLRI